MIKIIHLKNIWTLLICIRSIKFNPIVVLLIKHLHSLLALLNYSIFKNSDFVLFFPELLRYIHGPKGFPQLVIKDYIFIKLRDTSISGHWRCRMYKNKPVKCEAKCKVTYNEVILFGRHSHPPDLRKLASRKTISEFWSTIITQVHT